MEWTTMARMSEPTSLGAVLQDGALAARLRRPGPTGRPAVDPDAPAPEDPAMDAEAERRRDLQARRADMWGARVPALYRHASFSDLDAQTQHAFTVTEWLTTGSRSLILAGPVGSGKTHAAYAVANTAVGRGLWVQAFNVTDLMDALRPGSTDHGADKRARQADLLLLDDLTAKATDWEAERLTAILDARTRQELRTIVTTNVTRAQIVEAWGERLMDRLAYRMTSLTFSGDSRRVGT